VFLSNNLEGFIHIHSWVGNHLEEDHLIKTHLEDRHLIHMLDFMDGKHLIQGYLCYHGINRFQFNPNQPINCHIKSFNTPHMWIIMILMLTLEFSKKQSKLMVRLWRRISSICLILLYKTSFQNGVRILYKIVQDCPNCTFDELEQAFCKSFQIVKNDKKNLYIVEESPTRSWWVGRNLLWTFA